MAPPVFRDFENDGFGWRCVKCAVSQEPERIGERSRLLSEGESESKNPILSTRGLARWADREAGILECASCGHREQGRQLDEDS